MYHPFFVYVWLKNSIFGEFSNIYLLSAQNRVKWRHKIRLIAKNFRPILIFFARDDVKLMHGEVCQVSCRYTKKWRSYSGKTEGGSDPTPPGGGGLIVLLLVTLGDLKLTLYLKIVLPLNDFNDTLDNQIPVTTNKIWREPRSGKPLGSASLLERYVRLRLGGSTRSQARSQLRWNVSWIGADFGGIQLIGR